LFFCAPDVLISVCSGTTIDQLVNLVHIVCLDGFRVVDQIRDGIEASIRSRSLVNDFWLAGLAELSAKFYMLLGLLLVLNY
jgi:hypothetical protein